MTRRTTFRPRRPARALLALLALWACMASALALAGPAGLPNQRDALEGITTAGQPGAADFAAIAAAGYKSVIDLRGPGEDRGLDEPATVEGLGMEYASLAVDGAGGITYAKAEELDRLLAGMPKPVLLHCASSNRVGALLALRARAQGANRDAALELGLATGLGSLKPVVEQKLGEPRD